MTIARIRRRGHGEIDGRAAAVHFIEIVAERGPGCPASRARLPGPGNAPSAEMRGDALRTGASRYGSSMTVS